MKRCRKCKILRKESEFRTMKNQSVPGGMYTNKRCRICERKWQREYHLNPQVLNQRKFYHIQTRYGLTKSDYKRMLAAQGGRCAICRRKIHRPFTDHNHDTGKVRGLLCGPCNMYIGHIKESIKTLQRAQQYITLRA